MGYQKGLSKMYTKILFQFTNSCSLKYCVLGCFKLLKKRANTTTTSHPNNRWKKNSFINRFLINLKRSIVDMNHMSYIFQTVTLITHLRSSSYPEAFLSQPKNGIDTLHGACSNRDIEAHIVLFYKKKKMSTFSYCTRYYILLLKLLCQKQKPQIDSSLQNVLHIYGQEESFQQ